MKYRQKILLLTGPAGNHSKLNWDDHDFFPGSRLKNYGELLGGYGIPYTIKDAGDLQPSDIINGSAVRYSSIVFTKPLAGVAPDLLSRIDEYAFQFGIALVADTFLIKGSDFFKPFGIKQIGGLSFSGRTIRDGNGNPIYRIKRYPYAAEAFAFGVRPLLRFLTQNWFSKKLQLNDEVAVPAVYGDNKPAIAACNHGKARNYLFNFHPSFILKEGNAMHAFIRKLLETNANLHAASFNLTGSVCLRIDDPGSCERVHLEGYNPAVVSSEEWENLYRLIKAKQAHLNVAYVPQWVDDGNTRKGTLTYKDRRVEERKGGRLYNSWQVAYSKAGSPGSHNYAAEYAVIKKGVDQGIFSILSHGLTHLTIHVDAWLRAKNRYTRKEWYREFREMVRKKKPSNGLLAARMARGRALLQEAFGVIPEIIVPSAHEQTNETAAIAREVGFKVFSSRTTAFLRPGDITGNRKIGAFYHEDFAAGATFSRAGYPAIFVFHDYDILSNGVSWLAEKMEKFEKHGVRRFLSMEAVCFLLMAESEMISQGPHLDLKMDFSGFRLSEKLSPGFDIPIKVSGIVSDMTLNGEPWTTACEQAGGFSYFSIPFSRIKNAKLEMGINFDQ